MKSSLGFLFLGLLSLLSTASAAPAGSSSLATAPAPSAAAPGGDGHGGGCTAAKRLAALHTVNNFFTSRTEYNRTLAAKVLSKDSKYSTFVLHIDLILRFGTCADTTLDTAVPRTDRP